MTNNLKIIPLFDRFNLSSFYKKKTHLTLYQVHIYSLTARLSCKTNTRFLFDIFYIFGFLKKNLATCTALG